MCGIAGIVRHDGAPAERSDLERMLARLTHRGPDDEGIYLADGVGLGHRRLSIIDVTASGHQPMPNASRSCWITYNGELYNYRELRQDLQAKGRRFHSDSDTEVILQAYEEWGTECLAQFNGMFAFAIWDETRRVLFCARDRIGIKPFYYASDGRQFAFASEIKALLALPGVSVQPHLPGVLDYLAFQYVRSHHTLFKGIYKLLPGEMLVVEEGKLTQSSYWDVQLEESDQRPEREIVEELYALIDDAVRIQLRADVPVGTHLSGGLDSSLVTALAIRHHSQRLFSFNGRFAEGPEFDESPYARIMADAAGVELIDVLIDDRDFVANLAHLAWHMDEPTAGPGVYPQFFVCQTARRYVKVALGGQGGDEIFVGYPRYRDDLCRHHMLSVLRGGNGAPGYPIRRSIANVVGRGGLRSVLSMLLRGMDPLPSPQASARHLQGTAQIWGLELSQAELRAILDAERERTDPGRESTLLGRLLYHDLKHYLPALLHVEDRTSMAVSLESRVPLLDHRIVELVARVPSSTKFPPFRFKHLLRQVAARVVPEAIVNRTDKKGFPTPLVRWVARQRSEPELAGLLSASSLRRAGVVRGRPLDGAEDDWWRCWATLNLELWTRIFLEGALDDLEAPRLQRAS